MGLIVIGVCLVGLACLMETSPTGNTVTAPHVPEAGRAATGPKASSSSNPDDNAFGPEEAHRERAAEESLRERARQRVGEIRAAQDQLRAGANPGEVKEPKSRE